MEITTEQYDILVKTAKITYKTHGSSWYEVEDFICMGYMGLVRAIKTFDPNRKVKFNSYAFMCIRFGILTEMRFERSRQKKHYVIPTSLDAMIAEIEQDKDSRWEDLRIKPIDKGIIEIDTFENMIKGLDSRTKAIMREFYVDDYTMKEIAKHFGVSKNRIVQIIRDAKEIIKGKLTQLENIDI